MAVKGEAERRQAFGIVFGWGLVVFTGMVALGLSGRALVPDIGNVEAIFYRAASDFLPLVLAGIATAATLSAVMSTVDSLLLAAAGAVAHDMGINRRFPGHEAWASRPRCSRWPPWPWHSPSACRIRSSTGVVRLVGIGRGVRPDRAVPRDGARRRRGSRIRRDVVGIRRDRAVLQSRLGPPTDSMLSEAAHMPGDPFERVVPWFLPVLILWFSTLRRAKEIRS